jgi:hypothetical protein
MAEALADPRCWLKRHAVLPVCDFAAVARHGLNCGNGDRTPSRMPASGDQSTQFSQKTPRIDGWQAVGARPAHRDAG